MYNFPFWSGPKEPNYKCEHTLKEAFTSSNEPGCAPNVLVWKHPLIFLALWENVAMLKLLRKPNKLIVKYMWKQHISKKHVNMQTSFGWTRKPQHTQNLSSRKSFDLHSQTWCDYVLFETIFSRFWLTGSLGATDETYVNKDKSNHLPADLRLQRWCLMRYTLLRSHCWVWIRGVTRCHGQ